MPIQSVQRYCPSCQQTRLAQRKIPHHGAHLVMSILTVGLWAVFIWFPLILLTEVFDKFRCPFCGSKCRRKVPKESADRRRPV